MAAAPDIQSCPPANRPAALRTLHQGLPAQKQDELVVAIASAPRNDEAYWHGLLTAGPSDQPVAAAWVQPQPGNCALFWPPSATASPAGELFRAARQYAHRRRWPLVQLLLSDDESYPAELLQAGGFVRLARLAYMAGQPRRVAEDLRLQFVSNAGEHPERLAQLLEQTFIDTRDCPQLDGLRNLHDTLQGYRAQGMHDPAHWYFVQQGGRDAGVLLLTRHAEVENWELIYMGVAPPCRGAGLGRQIVQFALDTAARHRAQQLVLAVDADNGPALAVYHSAGMQVWDQQVVYGLLQARR